MAYPPNLFDDERPKLVGNRWHKNDKMNLICWYVIGPVLLVKWVWRKIFGG